MTIKPTQLALKFLFEQNHTFQVPKYQRGYAWDDEAINDFIEDIEHCLNTRAADEQKTHFFGGVVAARVDAPKSNRSNYEIIDGQQRLASVVMLAAAIVSSMRGVVGELVKIAKLSSEEKKAKKFLEETIENVRGLYLVYRDQEELEYVEVSKLTLSEADNNFFQETLVGLSPQTGRASHERIQAAWRRLGEFVDKKVLKDSKLPDKAKRLQLLIGRVLSEDCTVIFMCADTRGEAYQIFQVLNDRGVHLTDGDLLRARTMELLDQKPLLAIQSQLAEYWDRVLAYPPADTDSYLRWYFSSVEGKRPKSAGLADQFLEVRLGYKKGAKTERKEAERILGEVKQLDSEFALLRTLNEGEWPFNRSDGVTSWDRERLHMLVVDLKHTNVMPLLLALRQLPPQKFAEAVASLERFVFRYKTIGNAHIGQMTELYLRHAKLIRKSPSAYNIKMLRSELADLAKKVVSDQVFEANLRDVRYTPQGGNGHIRYFLITIEDFLKWYEQGAQGTPKCKDKTRVFDLSNTTLEHIHPQSANSKPADSSIEQAKHTIGNLTILGPGENDSVANKSFIDKKTMLAKSSLQLNRDISQNQSWTAELIAKRTDALVKMAIKIFVP